jgi:hypothetical protein
MTDGTLWRCSGCGGAFVFLARIGGRDLCAACWRRAGSPFQGNVGRYGEATCRPPGKEA